MAASAETIFGEFCSRMRERIGPFRGQVEYGDLRERIDVWESADGTRTSNVALVYETPGGSTDQINISFDHAAAHFSLIADDTLEEFVTGAIDEVLDRIVPRIARIPE